MTTPEECAICLEGFESYHKIARPSECTHCFHVACITHWLQRNRTCPMCRREISYNAQIQWHTLFAVALVLTREASIDRCLCAVAFLDRLLRIYPNSQSFKENFSHILRAIEHLQITNTRLPFLAIPKRQDAIRERKRWKRLAEEFLEAPVKPTHLMPYQERIQQWI